MIIMPPAYPSFLVAISRHGVGINPAFLQSKPIEFSVEQTIFVIAGLDVLPSYPTSIGPFLKYVAIASVMSWINSRERSSAKTPLIPFVPNNFAILLQSTIDKFVFKGMGDAGVAKPGQRRRA